MNRQESPKPDPPLRSQFDSPIFKMTKVFDAIDISAIKLAPPRVSKAAAGCKTAYIQGHGGKKISIQTPLMTLPWDICPKKMEEYANVNAALSLSFVGMDENDENDDLHKFMKFMLEFDSKIKSLIVKTGGALGKKSEEKSLESNFKESLKESSSGDYPPTIQPKIWLSLNDGGSKMCVEDFTMDITVFNLEGEVIPSDEMKKGCPAAAIIEPAYVWCSALGVGITWVAKQVVLKPSIKETFGFSLGSNFDHLKESYQDGGDRKRAKVSMEETEGKDGTEQGSTSRTEDPLENEEELF